jgi:hypothetical protein
MIFVLYLIIYFFSSSYCSVDIIGPVVQADGIGQISIGIFETIKNIKKTSVITDTFSTNDISHELKSAINKNKYNNDIVFFTNLVRRYNDFKKIMKFPVPNNVYEIKTLMCVLELYRSSKRNKYIDDKYYEIL